MVTTPPILRPIASELKTDRLHLRAPREGDGERVYEAVVETLDQLRAWPASLPWAMVEPSVAVSETFCRESAAAFIKRSTLVYLVFDNAGNFVASTSLHRINWAVPKFEVGYWCRASRQHQGLMTEALGALMRYAFDGLGAQRVEAFTEEQNLASRLLCEKFGMQLEGVMRKDRITPSGSVRNTCIYAAVASDQ
jgi:RimJ/RimL family protein N-acetyltransferase